MSGKPDPFKLCTKEQVRAALQSLPVSREGRFIHVGMTISTIASLQSTFGSRGVVTAPVRAVSAGGRVHLGGAFDGVHAYRDGIRGEDCYVEHGRAVTELEQQLKKVNITG